jgi:dipeptidyl-peptidase-4
MNFKHTLGIYCLLSAAALAQGTKADYDRAAKLDQLTANTTFRENVMPHWFADGDSFWYTNALPDGKREYVLVDATKGTREVVPEAPKGDLVPLPMTDARRSPEDTSTSVVMKFINHSGEAAQLFWIDTTGGRKSYATIANGASYDQHTYEGHIWFVQGADGKPLGMFEAADSGEPAVINPPGADTTPRPFRRRRRDQGADEPRGPSNWSVYVRDNNIWARQSGSNGEIQLSKDGTPDDPYQEPVHWSPDGKKFIAFQVEPEQQHTVYEVQSSPGDQVQPKLIQFQYLKPGDKVEHPHPRLFDLASGRETVITDTLFPNPFELSDYHWSPDSSTFNFTYNQRGHQIERIIAVDAKTGTASTLVEEKSDTFIDYSSKSFIQWLDKTNELLWMSERSGLNKVYLIDARTGAIKANLAPGPWIIREVDNVDVDKRQAYLRVMGGAGEDPYHFHLARVNLDGSGFTVLTPGDGTHRWRWSPDRKYIIDSWSRVDLPNQTVLRNATDGSLVCELEKGDITKLLATGWKLPERFVAKGRDGTTDIWGVIYKPTNFDPNRKYPVIEDIYAGPQDFFTTKPWHRITDDQRMTELGFIVVQLDGMGTNWRSKAFHDVCFKNLKDAGLPDRIAWMKAAQATRPWMDLTRVGIFGTSAGAQSALSAMLWHGDFFKAAVADSGCYDNRMDKIWWNEQWMGWPVGPEYADNSCVTHAANLTGSLFLIAGELDHNVDPASTMQVVNALVNAGKDFDLLIFPGKDHGPSASEYGRRRRDDFFVRHLLGVEPRAS